MENNPSPSLIDEIKKYTKGIYDLPKIKVKPSKSFDKKKARLIEEIYNDYLRHNPWMKKSYEQRVKEAQKKLLNKALYGVGKPK